jgi:carboxyl-terminal processing protease
MKKNLSGLLILALSVLTAAAAETSPQTQDYWVDAKLSLRDLDRPEILGGSNCQASQANFHGCVSAINAIALPASLRLLPTSLVSSGSGEMNTISTFGSLSLVKLSPAVKTEARSLFDLVEKEKVKRIKLDAAMKSAFVAKNSVNFIQAIEQVIAAAKVKPEHESTVTAAAFNAYLQEALDPHSHIKPRAEVEAGSASVKITGIGVNIQEFGEYIVVQSVIDGGPAKKAGVLANDLILSVDGFDVRGVGVDETSNKIRGASGTTVRMKVMRLGREIPVKMVRQQVDIENITTDLMQVEGQKLGYLKLKTFSDGTACTTMAEKIIVNLESEGARGLILDLRDNGGGLIEQAVCMGGLFVGANKVIVGIKNLETGKTAKMKSNVPELTDLPLIVLINANSASASEVLSGALQDYKRAWLVGDRSFGKATVQADITGYLQNQAIIFYKTVERFYQPSGRTNQLTGIQPDFVVPAKLGAPAEELFTLREGDFYANAFKAVGTEWKQPRAKAAAALKTCLDKNQNPEDTQDSQLQAAKTLLLCGLKK